MPSPTSAPSVSKPGTIAPRDGGPRRDVHEEEIERLRSDLRALSGAGAFDLLEKNYQALLRERQFERDRCATLELVARNEPQDLVLESILDLVARQEPTLAASIFLVEGGGLALEAARGLPAEFVRELREEPPQISSSAVVGADMGARAAITASTAEPPNLDPFRQSLLVHGWQSCAMFPAAASDGRPLGILACYGRQKGMPGPALRKLLERAAGLAALALEHRRTYTTLAYQARHDTLTSLPNRLCFHDSVRRALGSARRRGHRLALLRLDLDNFKQVNDMFGHRAGDAVLREIARRLRSAVRASAGISLFPDHASDAETLFRQADTALYAGRAAGRNGCHLFRPNQDAHLHRRFELEFQLRRALERDQFHLAYQPQYSAAARKITGVEALLRWSNPAMGPISPERFIPAAESIGLIVPLGRWVLEEACRQAVRWINAGHNLRMAVNVSPVQFARPDFTQTVLEVVEHTGMDARLLELELTESCVMADLELARGQMEKLRAAGIRMSLDDFGTGYSSLSCLHVLPVDALKIDRSFIRDLGSDTSNARLVEAVVRLAQSLRLAVVAEGVENRLQLEALSDMGCEYVQGFLFEKPHSAESIEEMLGKRA